MQRVLKLLMAIAISSPVLAETNIPEGGEFAWGENIGWTNFRANGQDGVVVTANYLSGFAWSGNVGWIYFGNIPGNGTAYTQTTGDTGVNVGATGELNGFAWGANIGWVNFDPVTINLQTGEFSGFAWGENVGWINMDTLYGVRADLGADPTPDNIIDFLLGRTTDPSGLDVNTDSVIDAADVVRETTD